MLVTAIEMLANDAADPLVSEDSLAWGELFAFQNTLIFGILCSFVVLDGFPFHATNCAGAAIWDLKSLLSGNACIDYIDFEVFEDENEMLEFKMIQLETEL